MLAALLPCLAQLPPVTRHPKRLFDPYQIVAIGVALVFLVVVIDLVRRRRLTEKYSLLWLFSGVSLLGLAIWRSLLDKIAIWLGVAYGPSLLIPITFFFLLAIVFHLSVALSRQNEQVKRVTQRLALIELELRQARHDTDTAPEPSDKPERS